MGRKPGKIEIPKEVAKTRVLEYLAQGRTVTEAMLGVGRNDATYRQWVMLDPEFKDKADKARLAGKGIKADLANIKQISFEEIGRAHV